MFEFLRQRAYLQYAVVLAAGTAFGAKYPPPLPLLLNDWWLWLLLAAGLAGLWLLHCRGIHRFANTPGFVLLALIGFCNAALAVHQPLIQPLRRLLMETAPVGEKSPRLLVEGEIISLPKHKNGHLRFMLRTERLRPWVDIPPLPAGFTGPREPARFPPWNHAGGRCLLYVRCDSPPDVERGDRIRISTTLEEVLPPRNSGQFDYRGYLLQRGTVLTGYSPSAYSLRRISDERKLHWVWLSKLRQRLVSELERYLPPERADLAVSAVYGDKITELDQALWERFRRSGLSHILVASGTQVSLLMALVLTLGYRGWRLWPMLLRGALTLGIVLVYAVLAGLETSIVRALVMGIVVLLSRLTRRDSDGLTSLSQAAIIVVMADPLQLFGAGFQLSFAATFGLIYCNGITLPLIAAQAKPAAALPALIRSGLAGLLDRAAVWLRRTAPAWRKALLAVLSTTAGAQLFVVPVLADQFNQLSLWGLFSNAVAVPLSFFLLLGGALLSFGLGQLPLCGPLLVWAVDILCRMLDGVAGCFAALPWSDLAVPRLAVWEIACTYALIFGLGEWWKLSRAARGESNSGAGSQRQLHGLAWICGLCCVALLASLLCWVLVPRPALSALALPGAEAYIWTGQTGSAWLLISPSGLNRGRNADTIRSALRSRGVNSLRGIVWLGDMPAREPLPELKGPRFDLRALPLSPRRGLDPQWEYAGSRPAAVRLAVGRDDMLLVFNQTPMQFRVPEVAHGNELALCSSRAFDKLDRDTREELSRSGGLVVIDAESSDLGIHGLALGARSGQAICSGSELRVVPGKDRLRIKSRLR